MNIQSKIDAIPQNKDFPLPYEEMSVEYLNKTEGDSVWILTIRTNR